MLPYPTGAFAGINPGPAPGSPAAVPGQELGNATILTKQLEAAKTLVNSDPSGIDRFQSNPSLNKTISYKLGNQTAYVGPASLPTTIRNRVLTTLNNFYITNTRAAHEDTDTATITAQVR